AKRGREPAGPSAARPGREDGGPPARERRGGDPGSPGGDRDLRKGDAGDPARTPATGSRGRGSGRSSRGRARSKRFARGPFPPGRHVLPGAGAGGEHLRGGGGRRQGGADPVHRRGDEDDERDRRGRLRRGRRGPRRELPGRRVRSASLPPPARRGV
ncbi:MAG: Biotin carboxyl carrier protein of acetyl-CoA carboxylase, partial [uncultured Rubrobacteraceae bacterium]